VSAHCVNSSRSTIVGLFPELLGVGGVQEAGRQTAAALTNIAVRRKYSIHLIALNDPVGAQSFQFDQKEISFNGFSRRKVKFALSAISVARKQACIAIAAHPHLAVPISLMKMVRPNLRSVVMSHGVDVWKPLPYLRRSALLHADLALAPSSDTARMLAEVQGVPDHKIRKLAWPISPEFLWMAERASELSMPKEFPRGRVILTVGRETAAERYKGTDELIRAVGQLRATIPDIRLVVAGEGDDLPRLRQLANNLGVSDSVNFLGGIRREQLAACYARCHVFALPSTGEGFGLVYLEAMAFAKPVLGVACGGVSDVVQDGVNGLLIPPHNLRRLVHGLETLLNDSSLRQELGFHGAEIVRRKYRFESFESELESILIECGLDYPSGS
jgi:phosphatidyl-myo-inositol dimannoside synthase